MMAGKPKGFPAEIANAYKLLHDEAFFLHAKWYLYCDLYGSKESLRVVNLLPGVFNLISESLRLDVLMGFARILDPQTTGTKHNLTLERLVHDLTGHCPTALHDQIKHKLNALKLHCEPFVEWRNQWLAHKDLHTAFRRRQSPLRSICGIDIDKALEMLADLLNGILQYFEEDRFSYKDSRGQIGTGEDLIMYLKNGWENSERGKLNRLDLED